MTTAKKIAESDGGGTSAAAGGEANPTRNQRSVGGHGLPIVVWMDRPTMLPVDRSACQAFRSDRGCNRWLPTIRQGLAVLARGILALRQAAVKSEPLGSGDVPPPRGVGDPSGGVSAGAAPPPAPAAPPQADDPPTGGVVPSGRICPGCAFLQGQKSGGRQHLWKPPCVRDPRYQRGPYQRRE